MAEEHRSYLWKREARLVVGSLLYHTSSIMYTLCCCIEHTHMRPVREKKIIESLHNLVRNLRYFDVCMNGGVLTFKEQVKPTNKWVSGLSF